MAPAIKSTVGVARPNSTMGNSKSFSLLHQLPGELRNAVYAAYFPDLPPAKTPLARAHEYRPNTDLCFADKALCSETLANLKPISQAWNACTWTVDLDHFFPPADPGAEADDKLGAMYPADVTAHLTDADAANIRVLEFSTSAFMLPAATEEGKNVLTKPFVFHVHRSSTNRLVVSTPLTEQEWQSKSGLEIDSRVCDLLFFLHVSLCTKEWYDNASGCGRGRHAWTALEIEKLLQELEDIISGLKMAESAGGGGLPAEEMQWAQAWEVLDGRGVWDSTLPGDRKMRLCEMESWAWEYGWNVGESVWAVEE